MSSIDGSFIIRVQEQYYQQALKTISGHQTSASELAGFMLSNVTELIPFITADCSAGTITGDVDELVNRFGELGSDILYLELWNSQVGETIKVVRKGKKKLSQKAFWQILQEESPTLYLHYALANGIKKQVREFNNYDNILPNLLFNGTSLLSLAIEHKNVELVEKLLALGADPNVYVRRYYDWSRMQTTPLILALKDDRGDANPACIRLLLDANCDVNICDKSGCAPIHYAAGSSTAFKFLPALVELGANINSLDEHSRSALAYCLAERDDPADFMLMIDLGADIHLCDEYGGNALWHASGNPVAEEFVISQGVDQMLVSDAVYEEYDDLLSKCLVAIYKNDLKRLRIFLKGINTILENRHRELLFDAVRRGRIDSVKLLIDAGLEPHTRMHGILAVEEARENGWDDIHYYLNELTVAQRSQEEHAEELIPILFRNLVDFASVSVGAPNNEEAQDYFADDFSLIKGQAWRLLSNQLKVKEKAMKTASVEILSPEEAILRFQSARASNVTTLRYGYTPRGWKVKGIEFGW